MNSEYLDPPRYERESPGLAGDREFYCALARESMGRVLELGCGTGRLTLPIARAGIPIVGLDSAESMLTVARGRAGGIGCVDWIQGDMRALPLSGRFGLIFIAYRTFQHLLSNAGQRACLAGAFDLLIPGARLALNVVNPVALGVTQRSGSPLISRAVRRLPMRYVFASEMRALLEAQGYELEALYGWFDGRRFDERDSSEMVWVARRPRV
jgi:SAM-dependent methyltransferase